MRRENACDKKKTIKRWNYQKKTTARTFVDFMIQSIKLPLPPLIVILHKIWIRYYIYIEISFKIQLANLDYITLYSWSSEIINVSRTKVGGDSVFATKKCGYILDRTRSWNMRTASTFKTVRFTFAHPNRFKEGRSPPPRIWNFLFLFSE